MANTMRGDFIGFTFNGVHSSTLGIIRVSNGSRYEEDLLPSSQDKVVDAPGADGTYFFNSYYKQKIITVSFAFDNLLEEQIRKIKQLFGDKQLHELWFDETPYKAYMVKVSGVPKLKYICFEGNSTKKGNKYRIYKGEGTISFVAFSPFAFSRFKYIEDYDNSVLNKEEWLPVSGIGSKEDLDKAYQINRNNRKINLWNGGDIPTDFKLLLYFNSDEEISGGNINLNNNILKLNYIYKEGDDVGVQINTKLKLIQGFTLSNGKVVLTENLYNKYISGGDFFKIPLNASELYINGLIGDTNKSVDIEYQYWYL